MNCGNITPTSTLVILDITKTSSNYGIISIRLKVFSHLSRWELPAKHHWDGANDYFAAFAIPRPSCLVPAINAVCQTTLHEAFPVASSKSVD